MLVVLVFVFGVVIVIELVIRRMVVIRVFMGFFFVVELIFL